MVRRLHITDVSPRDGLQNESTCVSVEDRVALIERLRAAGIPEIEAGSFVSPTRVPQMAESGKVFEHLSTGSHCFSALVPNEQGLERAMAAGLKKIALFVSTSETFSRRNLGTPIDESLRRYATVTRSAKQNSILIRGYISCAVACPFEGEIEASATARVAERLIDLGVDEIDIADTLGVAMPLDVAELLESLTPVASPADLVFHFHDTFGRGLACALEAIRLGVRKLDASVGGLGGCPFAPGSAGNLATEDLVLAAERMGYHTGIDTAVLLDAAEFAAGLFGRSPASKTWQALRGCGKSGGGP